MYSLEITQTHSVLYFNDTAKIFLGACLSTVSEAASCCDAADASQKHRNGPSAVLSDMLSTQPDNTTDVVISFVTSLQ